MWYYYAFILGQNIQKRGMVESICILYRGNHIDFRLLLAEIHKTINQKLQIMLIFFFLFFLFFFPKLFLTFSYFSVTPHKMASVSPAGQINNVDKIPSEQKSAFYSFLQSLASFTGDLSSITCPVFLLAPDSYIEYS